MPASLATTGVRAAFENLRRAQLAPAPRELLGRLATIVRHDEGLDQCVQFESPVAVARRLSHKPDPLIDARRSPARQVPFGPALPERGPRQPDDIGLPCREREELPAIASDEDRGGRWTGRGWILCPLTR